MPPKNSTTRSRGRKSAEKPEPALNKSTASIFKDGAAPIPSLDAPDATKQKRPVPQNPQEERDLELELAGFPFNIIYRVQDFVSDNINVLKFVQLMVFAYILEIIYLNRNEFEQLTENLFTIGFNFLGVSGAMILNYVKSKQTKKDIPEFNYLYATILPFVVNLIHYDKDWFLVNLTLNYLIVEKLNPVFRIFSAIGFYEVYNVSNEVTTFTFVQICVFHVLNSYVLDLINEGKLTSILSVTNGENSEKEETIDDEDYKTFTKTEIQMIGLLVVNLFFNKGFVAAYLPLAIFQKLLVSFIVAILALFQIYSYLPTIVVAVAFAGIFYGFTIFQLNYVLDGQNAILWLYDYIFQDEEKVKILQVWSAILVTSVSLVFTFTEKLSLNFRRKVWHFIIIAILGYSPKVLVDKVEFTLISLLGSIIIFLIVEVIRYNRFSPIGEYLNYKLRFFQDYKDSKGPLNVSYIYLIVGATIPILYDYILIGAGKISIIRYMGIVALGLGDSLASIIGRRFGSLKWKGSEKSLQGTATFIIVNFAAFVLIDKYLTGLYPTSYQPIKKWENLFVSNLICGVLEGSSDLNDNFFIPILLPTVYELLNRCY
ncbi:uncharacterized protein RJT20DRAFT_55280 [Scheffersomyces xylosifermentans]|uniref:uncharacterized protein n=1 Tax=Scheffersomyces xylosifermentans TaxID=1304137 RepID=UPI00315DA312